MKKYKIEITWGLIFILAQLIWILTEKLAGFHSTNIANHSWFSTLFAIPAIAMYVFALRDKRKNDYNGIMSYKEGFISGLIITIVITILTPLAQYIIHTFISPEFFSNIIAYSAENGMMTQEAAEAFFSLGNYIVQATTSALIMGIITSAIIAFFTKSKNTQNLENQPTAAV